MTTMNNPPSLELIVHGKTRIGRSHSIALNGTSGDLVSVEADIGGALPGFTLLGLPDKSLTEAKDRIRAAARNSGVELTRRHLTINLTPASLHKRGSHFDLAIVMAAYGADEQVEGEHRAVFIAALGLDGSLQHAPGVLPAVRAAVEHGFVRICVAKASEFEAKLVPGAQIEAYAHLSEVIEAFGGFTTVAPDLPESRPEPLQHFPLEHEHRVDLSDVGGQYEAKWALEVAAAGGHHLLLGGPPGTGKTMLAERLPTILPPLTAQHGLEVAAIRSITDNHSHIFELPTVPPFNNPHHSASASAIIGGGSGQIRPGAISLSHAGVLFLDEAPEFDRKVLELLRQPLETGRITLHRAKEVVEYPAQFQLVLAANPCPCGWGSGTGKRCQCTSLQRRRYQEKLSGPLMDRIDMQVTMALLKASDIHTSSVTETSEVIRRRVIAARQRQRKRLAQFGVKTNATIPATALKAPVLAISSEGQRIVDAALDRKMLTARGHAKVIRLAWTLADLHEVNQPGTDEVQLALHLRQSQHEA